MEISLNENIKYYRISFGLSQVELAKKLCVTKQCVSNWENDNVRPSVEMLVKIAGFFKVTTDQMLGLRSSKTIDVSNLTDEQLAHLRLLVKDFEMINENHSK